MSLRRKSRSCTKLMSERMCYACRSMMASLGPMLEPAFKSRAQVFYMKNKDFKKQYPSGSDGHDTSILLDTVSTTQTYLPKVLLSTSEYFVRAIYRDE